MEEEEHFDQISFSFHSDNKEDYNDFYLNFIVSKDMTVWDLHRFCKRFALALGYSEKNVEEAFGESRY